MGLDLMEGFGEKDIGEYTVEGGSGVFYLCSEEVRRVVF